jgi:hypothetical protein
MIKTGGRTREARRARVPAWIRDTANQSRWNYAFINTAS